MSPITVPRLPRFLNLRFLTDRGDSSRPLVVPILAETPHRPYPSIPVSQLKSPRLALDLAYGFHGVGMTVDQILGEPERRNWITKASKTQILDEGHALARLPRWLPIPLPYDWIFGVSMVGRQDEMGHGSYFFGASRVGHWGYFPALIVLKSPLALGVLAVLGTPWLIARRRALPPESRARDGHAVFVVGSVTVAFVLLALGSRIHIGVRHVIVVFVPLCVLSALVVDRILDAEVRHRVRVAALSLTMLTALEGWSTVRDPLASFNVAAGGRAGGTRISLVGEDWG